MESIRIWIIINIFPEGMKYRIKNLLVASLFITFLLKCVFCRGIPVEYDFNDLLPNSPPSR